MNQFWNFAFKNLFRNKRRTISTATAICVGFVGLNLLGAYIYRSKKALDATSVYSAQRGHISIYKKNAVEQYQVKPRKYVLTKTDIDEIQKVLESYKNLIDYTSSKLSATALLSNGTKSYPVVVYGFEPESYKKSLQQKDLLLWAKDWVMPSQLENLDIFIKKPETISITQRIGEVMALEYPFKNNEYLQLAGKNLDGDLNAINVLLGAEHTTGLQFLEDTVVLLPIQKVQELLSTDSVESYSIYLKTFSETDDIIHHIRQRFDKMQLSYDVFRFDDVSINSMHQGTMGFLYVMGGFFVFLICTAVSLTIINSLTMGIIERTREIGTLRAVGFNVKQVVELFTKESILLAGLSMIVGIVLSFIICEIVNRLEIKFFPPGASQKILFILNWNMSIATSVFILLMVVTWLSSYLVINNKMKVKLISLINDSGEN
ncbi:MAG: ABC transporter permease [Pseudobdellovibrio sp.]